MNTLKKLFYFLCTPCAPNQSPTVRYAFPLVFTFAALLGAAAVVTSEKSYIYIESSATTVQAGDSFEIDVYVNAHVAINAIDIRLSFPEDQVQVLGIDTGESVITLWAQEPYVEDGTIVLQGGTFRRGFKGRHMIATINAQAVESGVAQFSVDDVMLLAGDGSGTKVSVSETDDDSTTLFIKDASGKEVTGGVNLQGIASIIIITDIDGDGGVTLSDVSSFMSAWASKDVIYDFNGDGSMSFRDFAIILADSFLR